MSLEELARITRISQSRLRKLEACRDLPKSVEDLLAIAMALEVSVEDLVQTEWLESRRADVEAQRLAILGPSAAENDFWPEEDDDWRRSHDPFSDRDL